MAGAAAAAGAARARYPAAAAPTTSLYVTSGTALRRLTAGYNALAADLYWIRAIQYYGGIKLTAGRRSRRRRPSTTAAPTDYQLLYPLLDLTTTLDPRFNIAYRFGAIFLAEPYPGGAGRPDLADRAARKGLARSTR